ncbi:glycine zipper domain-containing protein [Chitinophaga sp. 212800010-3]|jgi:hypothetical protein|uniref:glycine zipper domain-containing protein n=1 Tax=unclassified Chitinophaga TaxID=2619133 RepID=UPI002DF004E6|nr:Glycine zipper family protein [Chitinophaga sp. 212800010-3]
MKTILIALAATVAVVSCNSNAQNNAAIEKAKRATIDSMNNVSAIKQQVVDSMNNLKHHHFRGNEAAPVMSSAGGGAAVSDPGYSAAPAATAPAAPTRTRKRFWKDWSHTAKGAVVGAGAGAITGAIVNPDHGKGAAIGTLIGAGVGAGTGALVDKKKRRQAQQ